MASPAPPSAHGRAALAAGRSRSPSLALASPISPGFREGPSTSFPLLDSYQTCQQISVSRSFKNTPELPHNPVPAAPAPAGRSFGMSEMAARVWGARGAVRAGSGMGGDAPPLNEAVPPWLGVQGCNSVARSPLGPQERRPPSSLPGHREGAKGFVQGRDGGKGAE